MIKTNRLDLLPASLDATRAALDDDRARLRALLDAEIPNSWPPELLDAPALEYVIRWLGDPANDPQWGMYFMVLRDGARGRTLVGGAGFKGRPSDDGTVEVGYGVLPEFQRRGFASETVEAFVAHAFALPNVRRVIAETLPDLAPSIGLLVKCGFEFIGDGSEPGVIRYQKVK